MPNKYVDAYVGFRRLDDKPLEANTLFLNQGGTSGIVAAQTYASSDPTAYIGQVIVAQSSDNSYKMYQIHTDRTLIEMYTSRTSIPMGNIDGLASTLQAMNQLITTNASKPLDISNVTGLAIGFTAEQDVTIVAGGLISLTGDAMTFNGQNVVTADGLTWGNVSGKPTTFEYTTQKGIAGGYAGIEPNGFISVNLVPIDTTLQYIDGKLGIKQFISNVTHSVTAITNGLPVLASGLAASGVSIGDKLVFGTTIDTYDAGTIMCRISKTNGTVASDYVTVSSTAENTSLDTITQGTTNKYISAPMLTFLARLGTNIGGKLTLDGTEVDNTNIDTRYLQAVVSSNLFSGAGTTASPLTLVSGTYLTTAERTFFNRLTVNGSGQLLFDGALVTPAQAAAPVFNSTFFSGTGTLQSPITLKGDWALPAGCTIPASAITSGTIDVARLPPGAVLDTTRLDKLEQDEISFTSSSVINGILTFSSKKFPKAICKSDYTSLLPVAADTASAKNGTTGARTYTLDLTGLTITGTWNILFD